MALTEIWHVEHVPHPVLPLWIATDADDRLVYVNLGNSRTRMLAWGMRHDVRLVDETNRQTAAKAQLSEYLAGQRFRFELELRPIGTPFQCAVWRTLAHIPRGETWSYAELASAVGRPSAARAVGHANGRNPLPIVLPCHRVIGRDGSLVGFGGGLAAKRWLLDLESPWRGLALFENAVTSAS